MQCSFIRNLTQFFVGMADRIKTVRRLLVAELKKIGSEKNWDHICKQIGMFSFTGKSNLSPRSVAVLVSASGLNEKQVEKLTKEHSVYLTANGRISVASLGAKNIPYVAKAIHEVSK